MVDGLIAIDKTRYDKLVKDSALLDALFAAGVDNWEGYEIALEDMGESKKEDD